MGTAPRGHSNVAASSRDGWPRGLFSANSQADFHQHVITQTLRGPCGNDKRTELQLEKTGQKRSELTIDTMPGLWVGIAVMSRPLRLRSANTWRCPLPVPPTLRH